MSVEWIRKERERLAKQLKTATWKGFLVAAPLVAAVSYGVWLWATTQFELLPGAELTLAGLIVTSALVAVVFVFVGLRQWFWKRCLSGDVGQMRSNKFATQYVDALGGPAALHAYLSVVSRARVEHVLERERADEAATEGEYATALRYLLLLEPQAPQSSKY